MKKAHLFILFSFLVTSNFGQKAEIEASISDVVMYLDGAQIHRTAEVKLSEGLQTVKFAGISSFLDQENIRLTGPEGVDLVTIEVSQEFLDESERGKRVTDLQTKEIDLQNEVSAIQLKIDAYTTEKSVWTANSRGENLNNDALAIKAERHRKAILETGAIIQRLNLELGKVNKDLLTTRKEIANLQLDRKLQRMHIEVTVDCAAEGNYPLDLYYVVREAGWVPLYDIKVQNVNAPIDVTYKAKLFNITGVDWLEVPIVLSTAEAELGITQPELEPWKIGGPSSLGFSNKRNDKSKELYKANKKQNENTIELPLSAVEFKIGGDKTVNSSGRPQLVEIEQIKFDASYNYYAIPKLETAAYLIANMTNWEKYNLVPGNANVYLDNNYVGQTKLETATVEDTLKISLGKDPRVQIGYETVEAYTKRQIIGSHKKDSYQYRLNVKNNRNETISIVLIDQLPISGSSDVDIIEDQLSDAIKVPETGQVEWHKIVAPSNLNTVDFGFSVKYPKNMKIVRAKYRQAKPRFF